MKTSVPWWAVGLAAAAGLGVVYFSKMNGGSAAPATATFSGVGVDNALQTQNFDALRNELFDYIYANTAQPTITPPAPGVDESSLPWAPNNPNPPGQSGTPIYDANGNLIGGAFVPNPSYPNPSYPGGMPNLGPVAGYFPSGNSDPNPPFAPPAPSNPGSGGSIASKQPINPFGRVPLRPPAVVVGFPDMHKYSQNDGNRIQIQTVDISTLPNATGVKNENIFNNNYSTFHGVSPKL